MTSTARPARFNLGQLCKAVGLARSSVLHYEALGLLAPQARSPAGYRIYGDAQLERLRTIRRLREAGLPLQDIRVLLDRDGAGSAAAPAALLEQRLLGLCEEAERIRAQQRSLARLLALAERGGERVHDKASWVALLRRAGFDDAAMRAWHIEFERDDPAGHAAFLAALGIPPAEADAIRRWPSD
jgi:DNA-binding transcriptional MerR regulator